MTSLPHARLRAVGPALVLGAGLVACNGGTAETPSAPTATPTAAATESPSEEPTASATATEPEAAEERVTIDGSQFVPEELRIAAGTEVVFENLDAFDHTVTEGTGGRAVDDPIVDEEIEPDGTVRVRFDEPGTYDITCEIHPTMQLTIVVEG